MSLLPSRPIVPPLFSAAALGGYPQRLSLAATGWSPRIGDQVIVNDGARWIVGTVVKLFRGEITARGEPGAILAVDVLLAGGLGIRRAASCNIAPVAEGV